MKTENKRLIKSSFKNKDTEKFIKRLGKKFFSAWKLTPAELKQLGGK